MEHLDQNVNINKKIKSTDTFSYIKLLSRRVNTDENSQKVYQQTLANQQTINEDYRLQNS